MTFAELLPIASAAVDQAADLMRQTQPGVITAKGDRDMVSEVDYAIEKQLRAYLAEQTPTIGFLGEEEGASGSNGDLQWALDPIDGTANFVRGIPLCAVSLGLVHHGQPVLGVVDLPFLGARYTAVQGSGAYANGQPIHASTTDQMSEAIVAIGDYATGLNADTKNATRLAITTHLAATVQRVRMNGSAAIDLVWLAHGRIDATITLSNKPWDMAAGVIIAREAGALVVDADGNPHSASSTATVGTTPALVNQITAIIRQAKAEAL